MNDSEYMYLVQLGSHIQIMDRGCLTVDAIQANEWVNLQIGKVQVDIDCIQPHEEVDEGILLFLGDIDEEGVFDCLARWELLADG